MMNLIYEPKVFLTGRQDINDKGLEDFLQDHQIGGWESDSEVGAEVLMEAAGRVCYMSFAKPRPGGNSEYLKHIKETAHGSVLEHSVWNFIITNVSRSLTHELVRHRAGWSYSQLSQRYVDESVAEYVVPKELQEEVRSAASWMRSNSMDIETAARHLVKGDITDESLAIGIIWIHSCHLDTSTYKRISDYLAHKIETELNRGYKGAVLPESGKAKLTQEDKTNVRKRARGAARSVLPNATETKLFVTVNGRAMRHFIELRGAAPAEAEIRHLAYKMWKILMVESPNLYHDYVWTMAEDGTPLDVTTLYRKV